MITTIALTNTFITSHNNRLFVCFMGRAFKVCKLYSLHSFQVYNAIVLTVVTMLYIRFPRIYSSNWKFVPFDFSPFPPHPPWQP